MVDWTKKWKKFGQGWFGEPGRHSNARKFGSAGGNYAYFATKAEKKKAREEAEKIMKKPKVETPVTFPAGTGFTDESGNLVEYSPDPNLQQKGLVDPAFAKELEQRAKKEKVEAEEEKLVLGEARKRKIMEVASAEVKAGKSVDEAIAIAAKQVGVQQKQAIATLGKSGIGVIQAQTKGARALTVAKDITGVPTTIEDVGAIAKRAKHTVGEHFSKTADIIIPAYKPLAKRVAEKEDQRRLDSLRAEEKRLEKERFKQAITGGPDADPLSPENQGVFDPLGQVAQTTGPIASFDFVDDIGEETPHPEELYPHAYRTKRLVDDFYQSLPELKNNKIDTLFKEGEAAFTKGDREALVNSIMDIDAERRKLTDRKQLVENVRNKVLNDQNAVELLHKDDDQPGLFNLGGFFGGGAVSSELAEQTKRVNESRKVVDEALQKGVTLSTNLRQKLVRMDGSTDYGQFEPAPPKNVTPFKADADFSFFDVNNVTLSAQNPLLGKNPATKLIDLKVL